MPYKWIPISIRVKASMMEAIKLYQEQENESNISHAIRELLKFALIEKEILPKVKTRRKLEFELQRLQQRIEEKKDELLVGMPPVVPEETAHEQED